MLFWLFVIKGVWEKHFPGGGKKGCVFLHEKFSSPPVPQNFVRPRGGEGEGESGILSIEPPPPRLKTSFHYNNSTGGQWKLLTDTTEKRNKWGGGGGESAGFCPNIGILKIPGGCSPQPPPPHILGLEKPAYFRARAPHFRGAPSDSKMPCAPPLGKSCSRTPMSINHFIPYLHLIF